MADKNYGNNSQLAELVKYISDEMKFPIMGAGGGFAPIGTEAYFDGQVAPLGWLICDGSTHNISDYPDLAAYYASQHGASNYYGGNGTTTFATPTRSGMPNGGVDTPDEHIVGEYRKTVDGVLKKKPRYRVVLSNQTIRNGVNNYDVSSLSIDRLYDCRYNTTKLNGSYHQRIFPDDEHEQYMVASDTLKIASKPSATFTDVNIILDYTKSTDTWQPIQEGHSSDGNGVFCVKATVAGDANAHQYSTEEQVVGTWIDGKPIYEKTWVFSSQITLSADAFGNSGISNNGISAIIFSSGISSTGTRWAINASRDDGNTIKLGNNRGQSITIKYVTLQYTKTS